LARAAETLASESVQFAISESKRSKPMAVGDLSDAPVEDELLHGDDEGEAEENGTAER